MNREIAEYQCIIPIHFLYRKLSGKIARIAPYLKIFLGTAASAAKITRVNPVMGFRHLPEF